MNDGPIKYSDLFEPDSSIVDLQKQLIALGTQYKKLLDEIKIGAQSLKSSIEGVTGATTQGQETIKATSALTEKLAKKEAELAVSMTESARELARKSAALRYNNNLIKNQEKANSAAAGSYDQLSAQYNVIKLRLDAMSKSEREAENQGKRLEKEAARLMAQMKALQDATGKHVLSVGDYGIATAHMAADIRNAIQAAAQMKIEMQQLEKEGKKGSAEWQEMSVKYQKISSDLKDLRKQYQITKLEMNALSQQTGWLNDTMAALSAGSGGLSAVTGTMTLFGAETDKAATALVKLNAVMAIANGINQAYNSLFKAGNVLLKIRNAQTWLLNRNLLQVEKSTWLARTAQQALNAVAKANPYMILAGVLFTVVSALVVFASAAARAGRELKQLNEISQAELELEEVKYEVITRATRERIKQMENELRIRKAQEGESSRTLALEKAIIEAKKGLNEEGKKYWKINDKEKNQKELDFLKRELGLLKKVKAEVGKSNPKIEIYPDLNGPAKKVRLKDALDIIQKRVDLLGKRVEFQIGLKQTEEDLKAQEAEEKEQARQRALSVASTERNILRKAEDAKLALIKQRFEKQRATETANTQRAIEDLRVQLRTDRNLTLKGRKAIYEQIENLNLLHREKMKEIDASERAANLTAYRQVEDLKLVIQEESFQKQRDALKQTYVVVCALETC